MIDSLIIAASVVCESFTFVLVLLYSTQGPF